MTIHGRFGKSFLLIGVAGFGRFHEFRIGRVEQVGEVCGLHVKRDLIDYGKKLVDARQREIEFFAREDVHILFKNRIGNNDLNVAGLHESENAQRKAVAIGNFGKESRDEDVGVKNDDERLGHSLCLSAHDAPDAQRRFPAESRARTRGGPQRAPRAAFAESVFRILAERLGVSS